MKKAATEEQLFDVALGAGAEDLADEGDEWIVTTPPAEVDVVRSALEAAKIAVKSSKLAWVAKNTVTVSGRDAELAIKLAETLDDHDDTQNSFSNFDLSEEDAARLADA